MARVEGAVHAADLFGRVGFALERVDALEDIAVGLGFAPIVVAVRDVRQVAFAEVVAVRVFVHEQPGLGHADSVLALFLASSLAALGDVAVVAVFLADFRNPVVFAVELTPELGILEHGVVFTVAGQLVGLVSDEAIFVATRVVGQTRLSLAEHERANGGIAFQGGAVVVLAFVEGVVRCAEVGTCVSFLGKVGEAVSHVALGGRAVVAVAVEDLEGGIIAKGIAVLFVVDQLVGRERAAVEVGFAHALLFAALGPVAEVVIAELGRNHVGLGARAEEIAPLFVVVKPLEALVVATAQVVHGVDRFAGLLAALLGVVTIGNNADVVGDEARDMALNEVQTESERILVETLVFPANVSLQIVVVLQIIDALEDLAIERVAIGFTFKSSFRNRKRTVIFVRLQLVVC